MHPCPWRVCDDHIGVSVLEDEVFGQDILHIASVEERIVYAIDLTIDLGIDDRLGYVFDTDARGGLASYEISNRASPRVEVIDMFLSRELSEVTSDLVQLVGLLAIGLVEGLWTYAEGESLQLSFDRVTTCLAVDLLVGDGVVALAVDHVEEGGDLGETCLDGIE